MDFEGWLRGDQVGNIHPSAAIHPSVEIAPGTIIYPNVVIDEGVSIGPRVTIFPGAYLGKPPKVTGIVPPKEYIPHTSIGAGCVIGTHAVIYSGVQLEADVLIGDGVRIRENTTVGRGSVVGSNSTIQNDAKIGRLVRIVDLSHVTAGVTIEDEVFWSVGVLSMNDNRDGEGLKRMAIGKGAFIGGGALLLPGADVGEGSIVGAGSVVTRPVDRGWRVQGVPARRWGPGPQIGHDLSYDGTPAAVHHDD